MTSGRVGRAGLRVALAIEVDGLLQRFGRAVPDGVALLDRVAELRAQGQSAGARLDVMLVRFGPGAAGGLEADLDALGLGAAIRRLGAKARVYADGGGLAAPGERVILFAGRWAPTRDALAGGMPAYLVSDRGERDHRQLAIDEAPRVIAESLRLAVPRPMSPETRRGALLALPVAGPAAADARGLAALRADPHADWFMLGGRQIVYVEAEDVIDSLLAAGAELLARQMRLTELAVARPGEDERRGEILFEHDGFRLERLGRHEGDVAGWSTIRRAWIAPGARAFAGEEQPVLPGLADAFAKMQPSGWSDAPSAMLADEAGFDTRFARYVAMPARREDAGTILAFVAGGESAATLARIAASLERRPDRCAALFCRATVPPEQAVGGILWEQERNRLAAIVQVDTGDEARSDAIVDRALAAAWS